MFPKYKKNNKLTINTDPNKNRFRSQSKILRTPVPYLYRWSNTLNKYVYVNILKYALFRSNYDFYIVWHKHHIPPVESNQYINNISPNAILKIPNTQSIESSLYDSNIRINTPLHKDIARSFLKKTKKKWHLKLKKPNVSDKGKDKCLIC